MATAYELALYKQTAEASTSVEDFISRIRRTEGEEALNEALRAYLLAFPERRSEVEAMLDRLVEPRESSFSSTAKQAVATPRSPARKKLAHLLAALGDSARRIALFILALILFFVGINVLWIGGHKLWHWTDQKKLDELTASLQSADVQISRQRRLLIDHESSRAALNARLDQIKGEANHLSRIGTERAALQHAALVGQFNALVETYNENIEKHKATAIEFNRITAKYNKDVDEANALAKKIGRAGILVPGLGRRGHHSHAQ